MALGGSRSRRAENAARSPFRERSSRELLAHIVDLIAEVQSQYYAVFTNEGDSEALLLRVADVASFDVYVALGRYLNELTTVNRVSVSQLNGSLVEFLVYLDASIEAMRQEISLGRTLQPLDDSDESPLRYRWQGSRSRP